MRRILITGGTGSLGSYIAKRWGCDSLLTLASRDDHKQAALRSEGVKGRFVLADICDFAAMRQACAEQDICIHTAALKVVSSGEANPGEYLRVNALGTQTLVDAWRQTHDGDMSGFLLINSDKALNPENLYGATKMVAEKIVLAAGGSSLRYGNVVGSAGSMLQKWQAAIAAGFPITVRQPTPTRFFLNFYTALDLIQRTLTLMHSGLSGAFVPTRLCTFDVQSAAEYLTTRAPIWRKIEREPLLPGEKQHEILISEREWVIATDDQYIGRVTHSPARSLPSTQFNSRTAQAIKIEDLMRLTKDEEALVYG